MTNHVLLKAFLRESLDSTGSAYLIFRRMVTSRWPVPIRKYCLTLNGEIYNAFDFKEELIQWGFQFKSTSDTEIVLAFTSNMGLTEC